MANRPQIPPVGNVTFPAFLFAQPPGVQSTIPGVQPTIPRIQPTIPGVQPTVPQIQPTVPRIQPTVPQIQPTVPRIQTTTPTVPRIQTNILPTIIRPTIPPVQTIVSPVQPTTPTIQTTIIQPTIQPQDNYYPQDDPRPEEFKFQATAENTAFIQATIQTARQLFPSLETHIQVAETVNVLPDLRRRSQFPSYMRDASPFEIYKIYQGEAVLNAIRFLNAFTELTHGVYTLDIIRQEERTFIQQLINQGLDEYEIYRQVIERFLGLDWWERLDLADNEGRNRAVQYSGQLSTYVDILLKDNDMRGRYGADYRRFSESIFNEMVRRGYSYQYVGFIRDDIPAGRARDDLYPLTPENFVTTITPDQEILMEEWRKEALRGGTTTIHNLDMLGLRPVTEEYNHTAERDRRRSDRPPILQTIGFSKDRLRTAVLSVADRLNPNRVPHAYAGRVRNRPDLPITRDYIRYEEEKAEYICGRKIHDISNEGLTMGLEMTKAYYMMLYNELRIRGLLNDTQF